MIRVRMTYTKNGWLKYTSNLDVQKLWERAIRRAGLPLAYSQGFHPQPRMNLAAPLPLGFTSSAELIDVWFNEEVPLEQIKDSINPLLPEGMKITLISHIELSEDSLQSQVSAGEYTVELRIELDADEINAKVNEIQHSETLMRKRRGKDYDLRPLIEELTITDPAHLHVRLTMLPGATGRPEELLDAMGIDPNDARIERTALILTPNSRQ